MPGTLARLLMPGTLDARLPTPGTLENYVISACGDAEPPVGIFVAKFEAAPRAIPTGPGTKLLTLLTALAAFLSFFLQPSA